MNRIKKLFARSILDIYQLEDPKDGAHLVELNYPENLCYKGVPFDKDSIQMIEKLMKESLNSDSDCIFVGYLLDVDKFIACNSDIKHNGIIFRIDYRSGIVERKVTCNVDGLVEKFDYLIPIMKEEKEIK